MQLKVWLAFKKMNIQNELNKAEGFKNLELLAKQVVEGFITGLHKSPFHGFSVEFAIIHRRILQIYVC